MARVTASHAKPTGRHGCGPGASARDGSWRAAARAPIPIETLYTLYKHEANHERPVHSNSSQTAGDPLVIAGVALPLATAHRHRQVQGSRRDTPRDRSGRRADRHRGDPPQQHRPGQACSRICSTCCRRSSYTILPEHGRLLHRRRCGAHLPPRARTAGRPYAGQARSARRPENIVSRCRADAARGGDPGRRRISR